VGALEADFDYGSIEQAYYDRIVQKNRGIRAKWHHLKFHAVRQLVDVLAPDGELLDLGCGPGTFLSTLGQDRVCVGVDVAPRQVAFARRRYGSSTRRFLCCNVTHLPFDAGSFDVITSSELVEHLPLEGVRALLAEAQRCLRPGGVLVLTTPNYRSAWPLLEWLVSVCTDVDYRKQHVTRFRRETLRQALAEADFQRVHVRSFLLGAPFLAGLSWRLADAAFSLEQDWLPFAGNLLLAVAEREGP